MLHKVEPVFCITSDVDWASEDAMQIQQDIFDTYDIRATYFVTHNSPLMREWFQRGRVQLGIHPNFLPGSSHGNSIEEVIDTVLTFAPGAKCFRSHRYFDATPATHALVKRGMLYDSNLCTNMQQGIEPIAHESGLVRFPCFYEDGGTHFEWKRPWNFSAFAETFSQPGIKIISVHPMITALNVTTSAYWIELKNKFSPDRWIQLSKEELERNACREPGPRQFLTDLLEYVKRRGFPIMTMEGLFQNFGRHLSPLSGAM